MSNKIEKVEMQIEKRIVVLFLEKLEVMTKEERLEILKTIKWLNQPIFISNN